MYSSPETAVPFAAAVLFFCVLERSVSAVLYLFFFGEGKQGRTIQFLVSVLEWVNNVTFGVIYTVFCSLSALMTSFLWVTVLISLGSIMYVTYEQSPWIWTEMARSYNAFLGPYIQGNVVRVLEAFNTLFRGVIPLYNGVVFLLTRLFFGYLLPTVLGEADVLKALGGAIFDMVRHLMVSFGGFVAPLVMGCPDVLGDQCYDVANRTLDLMTPMADVRQVVANAVVLSHEICGYANPLVDALTYPFMDINFASALHNLMNSVLYVSIQMPEITYLRCTRHGSAEPLLCVPDMEPFFQFMAAGLRSLGYLMNNWLDVVFVIVQSTLGWAQISCSAELLPSTLDPGPIRASVFGDNQTVVVGLTGYLVAVTDGMIVGYEGRGNLRLGAWRSRVNISHGIAAVTYGRSSDADVTKLNSANSGTSTAMLGCICAHDPAAGLQIQCSILPYGGLLSNETGVVPVFFQQGSTVQRALHCADVDIVVQSIRWPATRFSTGPSGNVDCVTAKTCSKADASIWVIPRSGCDQESAYCDCYPYCMGIRLAASQTSPIVLYSAEQWKSKVYMVQRDCNLQEVSSAFVGGVSNAVGTHGVTSVQATAEKGVQFVGGQSSQSSQVGGGTRIACVDNLLTTTIINRTLHPAYDTPTEAFLRNADAPFAVTGDTILTAVRHGDGTYAVRVERLTGASGAEFTLSVVSNNFPANPPPNVPASLFSQYPKDRLTIPYARLGTLAVSSRDYVFFAVNPKIEVFDAYLHYCRNSGKGIDQFGLIMVSSYSPIRIWRVDAYRRCTVAGCGADLVKQVDIPDAFSNGKFEGTTLSSDCLKTFNEAVTHLEYVNEINIAVTVKHTNVNGSLLVYRTYWLHTRTMQLRGPGLGQTGPWVDDVPKTALSAYSLCPAMQILPEFGSLLMELVIAGLFLVKMPVDAVVYTPGVINLWSSGTVCSLQTHGHSVLQNCGADLFSLDDFFDALQRATNIFWSMPTYVSTLISKVDSTDFIQNMLNGAAKYGAGSIDLWTARFQVLSVMEIAPSEVLGSLPTPSDMLAAAKGAIPKSIEAGVASAKAGIIGGINRAGSLAQGAMKVSSNVLGLARFGYTSVLKMVLAILQNVLLNRPVSAFGAWRIMVNTLDEMKDAYDSFIVDNMRQSCAGLSLMLGINNPWALYAYNQCLAGSTSVGAGVEIALAIFNLAPFTQCMCSGASGKVFGEYAMANCVPQASTTLKPVLLGMIQASSALTGDGITPAQALCKNMISYTRKQLVDSIQPWFETQYASLDALAASVDYAVFWLDPNAGKCMDFASDPNVVVIMPQPADYFQACAHTSLCRSKCSGVWDAFDEALAKVEAPNPVVTTTVKAESLFFPTLSVDAFTPMLIMAVIQPGVVTCFKVCGQSGDQCAAVAGVHNGRVMVQYYCIPVMISSSVSRTLDKTLEWAVKGSEQWAADVAQIQFADADGAVLVALVGTSQVFMASAGGSVQIANLTTQTEDISLQAMRIQAVTAMFNAPYACISINMLFRLVNGQVSGQPMHRTLTVNTERFPAGIGQWSSLGQTNFFQTLQGYSAAMITSARFSSSNPTAQFLLLPQTDGMPVMKWHVTWDASNVQNGVTGSTVEVLSTPSGVGDLLSSGQTLSQTCVVDAEGAYIALAAASPFKSTAWLTQLRISGASASAYTSQQVSVSVKTTYKCDVSSCVGCPDGEVQSLCDAVQQCAVIKCIGTPVNMRRVLCQVGENMANTMRETLAMTSGAWGVFVDTFMVMMDLSLQKGITGVALTWPDDRFFGYICTIKDNNVHFISIITSALNSVVQLGHSSVIYLQGGAPDINSNFNALSTMPLTALTGLVNQIFMQPLYVLVVAQKVMMCKVNGVLSIFDASGFTVRVGEASLQEASDAMVGQCLTQNFVTKNNNPADSSNAASTARIVGQIAQSSVMAALPQLTFQGQTLETLMHYLDGSISYFMGITFGLADFLESVDLSHCKLPDYFLNETVFCACGDTRFAIPAVRRSEGLAGVGLWCTGTLGMVDASNRQFVIYNPYSYSELQTLAASSDAYLACMSSKAYVAGKSGADCAQLQPRTPVLQKQGVSVLSVLTKCKENYMHRQWDSAAHILFNSTLFAQQVRQVKLPTIPSQPAVLGQVGRCLMDEATRPVCLQDYLVFIGQDPLTYWTYEDVVVGSNLANSQGSQFVDACQVFTGPANNSALTDAQRSTFRACLVQYEDSNCQLSSNLWTPQSSNAVPVAYRHGIRLGDPDHVNQIVQLKFAEAYKLVMDALKPLENYYNQDVLTIFFSPEGDIMHQLLDCIFMGPYDSVDYWPVDSGRLLAIPVWHRDGNGSSRGVDPRACVAGAVDTNPPYSCGSVARQAVIKYFFRDFLPKQQNATLRRIIGDMGKDLAAAWNDTSKYACLCQTTGGGPTRHSLACCGQNASARAEGGWLPPGLTTQYQSIPANHILRALMYQAKDFFRKAMEDPEVWTKYLDPSTLSSYNWSKPVQSALAVKEGLYRTDIPLTGYGSNEVNSPMLHTALWDQCHGLLSQVFFTIPMTEAGRQWIPADLPSGSVDGVESLAAFVRAAVRGAYSHSPVYRHYNVSYVPSDSRMCIPASPAESRHVASPPANSVKVSSFSVGTALLMDTSQWQSLPSYGVDAFPVHGCFCGWDGDGRTCRPPAAVCGVVPQLCPSFAGGNLTVVRLLAAKWDPAWPCPEASMGDQFGLMDSGEYDDWLKGVKKDYVISGKDLLKRGRTGLRVGNYQSMPSAASRAMDPARRVLQPIQTALPYCASSFARLSGAQLMDVGMLRAFVSQLFPVSQGVYESGASAYCLRYLVELALMEAMSLAFRQLQLDPDQQAEFTSQKKMLGQWRLRCESQLTLLGLCKNLDVFKPPVERQKRIHTCPFSIGARDDNDMYMTPGCLVHYNGFFYDPCNCPGFSCGGEKQLFSSFDPACRIAFDPRDLARDSPLGRWSMPPDLPKISMLRGREFVDAMLSKGSTIGNVPRGQNWIQAEGFLNVTGRHCDMLNDWWPDEAILPVGYHATVPCGSDETGYRTFDSAFAVQRTGGAAGEYTVVRMVYEHDATRDASRVDTHIGAGGLCRSSNLGRPFYEGNTMRVCTRQLAEQDTLDPAVPIQYSDTVPANKFGPEVCSTDSWSTPWHGVDSRHDSALYSVGTVPNMPDPSIDTTYPALDVKFGVGPTARIRADLEAGGTGWGEGCSDYAIRECSLDSDCPESYFCLVSAGVCMSNDFLTGRRCYRHDMCPGGGMCDGTGQCSPAYVVYLNALNYSMEVPVFAEECEETTSDFYYTDGSSPWENVPDWLKGHGMCSNKDWYMYSLNLLGRQVEGTCPASSQFCRVNASAASFPLDGSLWWPSANQEPRMFAVNPTVCDRDYEHLLGPSGAAMKGCSPKKNMVGNDITDAYAGKYSLEHARLFRNYENRQTKMASMPFSSLKQTGFLGYPASSLASSGSTTYLINCERHQNCYAFQFTVNGVVQNQRVARGSVSTSLQNYDDSDIFRCGVFAFFDSSPSVFKCRLDVQVVQLYVALCKTESVQQVCTCSAPADDGIGCVPTVNSRRLASICFQIKETYSPSYSTTQSNNENLQALFDIFEGSSGGLSSHVSGLECFNAIYNVMQQTQAYGSSPVVGVYYPFNFALYEIPLAWVYQCVYIGGFKINPTKARMSCQQYESAISLEDASQDRARGVETKFTFDTVKGGYMRADVRKSVDDFAAHVVSAVPELETIPEVVKICNENFKLSSCSVVPYCAKRRDWEPSSAMSMNTRYFLAGHYQDSCSVGKGSMQYALANAKMTYEDFVLNHTSLSGYGVEDGMDDLDPSRLPPVKSLIETALSGCIKMQYNQSQRWPLNFTLDWTSDSCMNFQLVLKNLVTRLINIKYYSTDINSLYRPSQNQARITPMTVTRSQMPDERHKCIFDDLADQVKYFLPDSQPTSCPFSNGVCAQNQRKCITYPLSYSTGDQACEYPLYTTFVSTESLLEYVWGKIGETFNSTLSQKQDFAPATPREVQFFSHDAEYFSGWVFDTSQVQRYLSNINPDTTKEVMCVLVDAAEAVNFTVCNDKNYVALQEFTDSLRQQGAAVVPPDAQLRWKVSQAFLARGALFAFANHTREDAHVLLRNLFNNETRCGVGEQMFNRVCLMESSGAAATKIRPWVPWMSGEWNPYEFCDVQLAELNQGNQEIIWPYDVSTCPECPSLKGQYRSTYMFDQLTPSCDSRQQTYAKKVDVSPTAPTNLCYLRIQNRDSECTHAQGMLGGERGQSVLNHPLVSDLYGATNLSVPQGSAGMYPRSPNTLLTGEDADEGHYGFVSIPGDELGITTLGLSIQQGDSLPYLRVARLPLQADLGYLEQMGSRDVNTGWVKGLGQVYAAEDALHANEQRSRGNSAWDCPVRRAAFYSRAVGDPFVTALPSPGRSRRIFGSLTGNLSAHPTVGVRRDGASLGQYVTSNGFCFCPSNLSSDQGQCRIALTNTLHDCSLKRTIDALQGGWVQSFVFPPTSAGGVESVCRMQLDWPYVGGTLRDGTSFDGHFDYASDSLNRRCHVLDRLKPFQYRYKATTEIKATTGNTLERGGVCHTGRAARVSDANQVKFQTTRCVKNGENSTGITVSCEDGSTLTLAKEASVPLDEMVEAARSRRAQCNKCSLPPVFTNAKGAPIQSESSFGIPFRFSAERAVAADLKQMLCKGFDNDAQCGLIFNQSAWSNGHFMEALLNHPQSLFVTSLPNAGKDAFLHSTGAIPDPAWDTDWVFCNNTDDLKAGKCKGKIPEQDWRADRFQSCYKTIRDLTRDSPDVMSSVDVCLTDSRLQTLCTAVRSAQRLVTEANCLASGAPDCMVKPFLYLPGSWDMSNREFVHQTVRRFYSRVTTYACPSVAETVIANNMAIMSRCAATPVGVMYLALQACRDIVDTMAQVTFYIVNIIMNGLLMAFSSDKAMLKAQIVYYWDAVVALISDLIGALSDIFFDMLFRMGWMGNRIYTMMQHSCSFMNIAYKYWLEVWCGIALDVVPMATTAIRKMAEYGDVASSVLNDSLDVIFQFLAPDAMSAIQAAGYVTGFRDRIAEQRSRQKQVIHDSLVQSKKEGKKADVASRSVQTGIFKRLFGGGGSKGGDKALIKTVAGAAASAVPGGDKLSFLMALGGAAYEQYQTRLLSALMPSDWTLFDFDSVFAALDTAEYFISSDDTCLAYKTTTVKEILNCTFPSLESRDTLQGAMMVGTRCWADAQRSVGTSNLLACSDSDTCYRSLYDTTPIVCASCPDLGVGYSLYGCSSVTKTCTCNVQTSQPDSCTSNEECYYASSTCLLVTGLDSMSYGNQPCAECSKQVQCIIRDGSGVGKCGCVFQQPPLQQCSQPPGQFVEITSPNRMCGYLSGADMTQSLASADWDALAVTQCLYLNPSYVYCAQVFTDSGVSSMAVGVVMASLTSSYQSRRLLTDEQMLPLESFELHNAESEYALPNTPAMHSLLMEDWNDTAAPCSALVWAYQQSARDEKRSANATDTILGPLDTMYLHKCAYWRQVGRETIKTFNLTALRKRDGFLLSMDDFAAALSQKSVLGELLQNPTALVFAAGHAPLLKPFYAAFLTWKSVALSLSLAAREAARETARNLHQHRGNKSDSTDDWRKLPLHDIWHSAWDRAHLAANKKRRTAFDEEWLKVVEALMREERLAMTMINASVETLDQIQETSDQEVINLNDSCASDAPNHTADSQPGARRILQAPGEVNLQIAQSWLTGPFTWPPTYYEQLNGLTCSVGSAMVQLLDQILRVLITFYSDAYPKPPKPPRSLWANLPKLTPARPDLMHIGEEIKAEGWIRYVYHAVWKVLDVNIAIVRGFFSNEPGTTNIYTLSTSMLTCDFSSVTYCTGQKKDLVSSGILLVMLYVIVAYVCGLAGLPILGTFFFLCFIPVLLWYVYGLAFTCWPMIPTCLIDDVISTFNVIFPPTIVIPAGLAISDGCLQNTSNSRCFKSCNEPPMLFSGWRDTVAFLICATDVPMCRQWADRIGGMDPLSSSLYAKALAVEAGDQSVIEAMSFCFMITFVNIIPVIVLLVLILTASVYVLYLPCTVIPKFISVMAQALAYTHQ